MERKWPDYYQESLRRNTIGLCHEKGWRNLLTCATCGHDGDSYGEIRWEDLPHYPERMTMAALARNAVFSECGHKGAWIDYRQEPKSPAGTFYPRTRPLDQ
mgnify:FL=1